MESTILFLLPIAIVTLSAWFIYKGLKAEEKIDWKYMIYGLLTITIIYAWLYYAPSLGVFSGLFEFLFAGGTSILAGITLLVVIPRSRKLFSLLLIILSPVIMYLCLDSGFYFSPSIPPRGP